MYLIIDLGNTNKKFALFENGMLLKLKVFREISLPAIKEFIQRNPGISHCILSSVIRHPRSIENFLRKAFPFILLDKNTPAPITNLYRSPGTLGKDRLSAAVAAACLFPGKNVLVINAGTCITYDFINSNREYLGGAISPGLRMRLQAMHTFTGKLPLVELDQPDDLVGTDTLQSVLSGVMNGAIAEMEGISRVYQQRFPHLEIILSGGDDKYFDKRLKISIFAFPNIVLHGLYQILEFNVKKSL